MEENPFANFETTQDEEVSTYTPVLHESDMYQKIPKYISAQERSSGGGASKRWVDNITHVFAQEKVDGSQLSFMVDPIDGRLIFRTKGGPLYKDVYFEATVNAIEKLQSLLRPGYIYRGETLTRLRHCRVLYGRLPLHSFVLFDVQNDKHQFLTPDLIQIEAERIGLEYAQLLYNGVLDREKLKHIANTSTSQFGGYAMVEGIVVKQYRQEDGQMMSYKIVSKRYKETKKLKQNLATIETVNGKLKSIAEGVCTRSRWEKAAIRFLEEGGDVQDVDLIGKLCISIKNDIIKEELDNVDKMLREALLENNPNNLNSILELAIVGVKEWARDYMEFLCDNLNTN